LIPISKDRKPVIIDIDKKLTVKPPPIVDYVSISTVILDNISNQTIKKDLLEDFYKNGGNVNAFNKKRSEKENSFIHAVKNGNIDNINILISNPFDLTRDNLPDEYKSKLKEINCADFSVLEKKVPKQNLLLGLSFLRDSNSGDAMSKLGAYENRLLNRFSKLREELNIYKEQHGKR
jgi:hypothetical protein